MTKKLTAVFALLALTNFALVACDGDNDTDAGTDAGPGGNDAGRDAGPGGSDGGTDGGGDAGPTYTPRGRDNPPEVDSTVDRAGRAGTSTALVGTFTSADEAALGTLRDEYNSNVNTPMWFGIYPEGIADNYGVWDGMDGTCDNDGTAAGYDDLSFLLTDDYLYVDTSESTCQLYLGVELESAGQIAEGAGGCGGRVPGVNVMDQTLNFLISRAPGAITNGVTADDATVDPDTFPFLAAPL